MATGIKKAKNIHQGETRGGSRAGTVEKMPDAHKVCQLAVYINGEQVYMSLPKMYVTAVGQAAIDNGVYDKGSDTDKAGRKIFRRIFDDVIEKTGIKKIV